MRELTLGKIYKNGIQYSGTTDAATNINYDNSKGAIRAGNVQGAIDEIMETTSQSRTLTQAEYDALPDTKYTDGIEYFITDAEPLDASTIAYDNTASKMTATNVQAGIDELNSNLNNRLEEVKTYIDNTTSTTSFKVLRKNGVVYVFFENVVISNASAGNIITFSNKNLKPKHNSYFPVSSGNVVGVRSDGTVSLYSSDLTKFTTGAVFGSFSYLAK